MLEVGLIGAGSIGQTISNAIEEEKISNIKLKIIGDSSMSKAKELADKHKCHATTDISEFSKASLDLVIEAASQAAVFKYADIILKSGIDLLIMSVGALTDQKLYLRLKELASENNSKIYIPSGAIGGIDLIKAAKNSRLNDVSIITRKSPKSLGLEMSKKEEKVVFNGTAREAVKLFPANVNVSATLSLAGLGPDKTKVKVICDPAIEDNIHEIKISGRFGNCSIEISNKPNPQNNKTSHLASLSVITAIKDMSTNIIVGS